MNSPYNLQRFIDAQQHNYADALAEIKNGKKRTHWMWYVFPQIQGLGTSETARFFAIQNLEEAEHYLKHPILGHRLIEISNVLLTLDSNDAYQIFGSPDDVKLHSSMTLFAQVKDTNFVFEQVLQKFFAGIPDKKSLTVLNSGV